MSSHCDLSPSNSYLYAGKRCTSRSVKHQFSIILFVPSQFLHLLYKQICKVLDVPSLRTFHGKAEKTVKGKINACNVNILIPHV